MPTTRQGYQRFIRCGSAKPVANYYGFGTKTTNFACTGVVVGCAVFVPTTFGIDVKQNVNVFKVGVNIKFGGGNFGGW
jgi:hypothetical protein